MRINELIKKPLTAFRQYTPSDLHDVYMFMKQYGFKEVGGGHWARIFAHPNLDYVLKIFKKNDLGYITFLKFALQNPSPYLPKFRGKLVNVSNLFSAIRMERLDRITSSYIATMPSLEISKYFGFYLGRDSTVTSEHLTLYKKIIEGKYPGLTSILENLASESGRISVQNDLGITNMMLRGEQLVIVDPLWLTG